MPSRIEDYALIGDCHTAALVARDGSIDWLCLPCFDSAACFAGLLGDEGNGHWCIAPRAAVRHTRRKYRGDTLILETEFTTDEGVVAIIDFMPPRGQAADVVRIVEGREGVVPMELDLTIRFDYGSVVPWVTHLENGPGIRAIAGPDALYLRTPVQLKGVDYSTVAHFDARAGERVPFTLTWTSSHEPEPDRIEAEVELKHTQAWWDQWLGDYSYQGRWRDAVVRSLLTLKAMTYAPSGGIVAAVTTSLPEQIGGAKNWDYRYCWLRDAAFTLLALATRGRLDEADQWRRWLLRAVAGDLSKLQILYGIRGERRIAEASLDWLAGYEDSRPVRTGNAAHAQRQLDVYGELIDALYRARELGLPESKPSWQIQRGIITHLVDHWREPDQGIWESRSDPRHYTYSKVMAWVAMDRGIRSVETAGGDRDLDTWRRVRDAIHRDVCENAFNPRLDSFVASYGSEDLDASLLLISATGFLPPEDPRVRSTVSHIQRSLVHNGLVYRNMPFSGGEPEEGAFLMCSFWLADELARQGKRDEAEALFERLLALRNDVGLLAEEYDPSAQRMLGNFPQAFSHVGLIHTALLLEGGTRRTHDTANR